MLRSMGRAFWWLVATERPNWVGDYLAILALVFLAALGALAIAWPWVSVEVPRALNTGLSLVASAVSSWLERLTASLPRFE